MKLYSQKELFSIPWPPTDEGMLQRSYLEPILKEGSSAHIENVQTELFILHIDNLFIPLTVNFEEYRNSYVCSLYSFLLYAEEEMSRHGKNLLKIILSPILFFLKFWFRVSKINQLVTVNNFLLSTNLYDALTDTQVREMTNFLKTHFPSHSILFRSLNSFTEQGLMQSLKKVDAQFITSRSVYIFDPKQYSSLPSKNRYIIRKDKKLHFQDKVKILQHEDFRLKDAATIKKLYGQLYLEKYSSFNPAFTERFFEQAIQNKTFILSGITYEGHLAGVIGFFKKNGVMATPIVGYDTTLPESLGLYRLLTALVIDESLKSKTIFHMSAGVGHFKRQRGAFQELECMAVICDHLPFYRRFVWKMLGWLLNTIGAPILKKHKL